MAGEDFSSEGSFWRDAKPVIIQRRRHSAGTGGAEAAPISDPGMWHFRANYMSAKAFAIFRDHPP